MAKTIKYPFPQESRKVMRESEKISFIQRVICVYRMLFWMLIPFVVALLPIIPAILLNEWYLLFVVVTIPVGIALFGFSVDKIMNL